MRNEFSFDSHFSADLFGPNGRLTRLHKGGGGDGGSSAIAAAQLAESQRQSEEQMKIQREQAAAAESERLRLLNQAPRYDANATPNAARAGVTDAESEARATAAKRRSMMNAVIAGESGNNRLGNSQQTLG